MRFSFITLVAVVVLALGGLFVLLKPRPQPVASPAPGSPTPTPSATVAAETKTIRITADGFQPNRLTVRKGTRVIFTNEDTQPHQPASDPHPIHTNYAGFDAQRGIEPGQEWGFGFDRVGLWTFHDHLFPYLTGAIEVVEGPVAAPQETGEAGKEVFTLVVEGKKLVSGPSVIRVTKGADVLLLVTADAAEEFHLHGYDRSVELEPGVPAELAFTATLTGRFPFELERSKTDLGALEVRP